MDNQRSVELQRALNPRIMMYDDDDDDDDDDNDDYYAD